MSKTWRDGVKCTFFMETCVIEDFDQSELVSQLEIHSTNLETPKEHPQLSRINLQAV